MPDGNNPLYKIQFFMHTHKCLHTKTEREKHQHALRVYRTILLLLISGNVFEQIMHNDMFKFPYWKCTHSTRFWTTWYILYSSLISYKHHVKSVIKYEFFLVHIQPECAKTRTRKNSVFGHFWKNLEKLSSQRCSLDSSKVLLKVFHEGLFLRLSKMAKKCSGQWKAIHCSQ